MKYEIKKYKNKNLRNDLNLIKIDFSLKREVLYVVIGAIIGAITMILPRTIYEFITGQSYYTSWIIFGHVIGIYSSYCCYRRIYNSFNYSSFYRDNHRYILV